MRVLLLRPDLNRVRYPSLGVAMISAVAKNLGHSVRFFDFIKVSSGQEIALFQSQLDNFCPDILGVSLQHGTEWLFVKRLLSSINLKNTITIFGGSQATIAPEESITIADVVVIGEGEETFSELLRKIENNEDFTNVAGCWVRKNGKVFKNEMRELISDLDTLPFPDWEIFNEDHFTEHTGTAHIMGAKIIGTFEGSRGCPYNCTYCTNTYMRTLFKGKGIWRREKSPERLIREMQLFKERHGLDGIMFVDDIFLTNTDKIRKFRDLFLSKINIPFVFLERPENMTEEKVRLISEAGASMVSIGIESGDKELRRNVLNRYHSQDRIISAFRIAKKYGLITHAFTMIGLPEQDTESMNKTYQLLKKAQPDTVQATVFYPLKKTKLFDVMVQRGEIDPNTPMTRDLYETKDIELIKYQFLLSYYYLPRFFLNVFLFARTRRFIKPLFNVFLALVRRYRYGGILFSLSHLLSVIKKLKGPKNG